MKKIEKRKRLKSINENETFKSLINDFNKGVLSLVSDTFNLWDVITKVLPANKEAIMGRDGKLVIRPDSGDPVDIICGEAIEGNLNYDATARAYPDNPENEKNWERIYRNTNTFYKIVGPHSHKEWEEVTPEPKYKGVIELLWDIFGGTVNEQGYKVLDPHIGAIYGDSITLDRQEEIFRRLADKGFAATNIVLGVGSFTYQYNTRDTLGFAAKGAWFSVEEDFKYVDYNIYKDPVTDDGTKKSLKGLCAVHEVITYDSIGKAHHNGYYVKTECTKNEEEKGLLQIIFEDGELYNQTTLTSVREKIKRIS